MNEIQERAFQDLIIRARKEQSKRDERYGLLVFIPIVILFALLFIDQSIVTTLVLLVYFLIMFIIFFMNVFPVYIRYQGILVNYRDDSRRHFALKNINYIIQKNKKGRLINKIMPSKLQQINQLLEQALIILEEYDGTDADQ